MLIKLLQFYPTWSIAWRHLPILARIFLLIVLLVCIYTTYSIAVTLLGLRSLSKRLTVENSNSLQQFLVRLNHRSANLHQIIGATFYLFGLTFFVEFQTVFWTPDSKLPVWFMILENMSVYFKFAAAVFVALLLLNSAQWFTSARIRSAELRLDTQITE